MEATRFARVCFEEAYRYAFKRKTFGQRLIDHPVIRYKLAQVHIESQSLSVLMLPQMARQVEATHSWLELVTYQMKTMPKDVARERLGGPLALLKAQATQVFEYCAREVLSFTNCPLSLPLSPVCRLRKSSAAWRTPAAARARKWSACTAR